MRITVMSMTACGEFHFWQRSQCLHRGAVIFWAHNTWSSAHWLRKSLSIVMLSQTYLDVGGRRSMAIN